MHFQVSDPYIERRSFVHGLPPMVRFFTAIAIVIVIISIPRFFWGGYGIIAALLTLICLSSKIPLRRIIKRLFILEPFIIVVALISLVQPSGPKIFLSLLLKGTLSLFTMIMMVATTRFSDLLNGLLRLRIPRILTLIISLMYRYLFLLLDETGRMARARSSRTFARRKWLEWKSLAGVIAYLFVRVSERAERIYCAMCARGWRE